MKQSIREHRPIALQPLGALQLTAPSQAGRPPFIAAASGLVRHGHYFYVVADDELQLGIFPVAASNRFQAGTLWPLLPGRLPLPAQTRKRVKPDFEALTLLPAHLLSAHTVFAEEPWRHGALLIIGSGSTAQRNRALLLALDANGLPAQHAPLLLDFTELYDALTREFGTVNIEGATVQQRSSVKNKDVTQLLLLQRGNGKNGVNAIVHLDLNALLTGIMHKAEIDSSAMRAIEHYQLGSIDGVPLSFTDATCLPDNRLLALAVAEDTDDAYVDGATFGCCLCRFDRDNRLQVIVPLASTAKTEGIALWQSGASAALAFVTDADCADVPAQLSIAPLSAFE